MSDDQLALGSTAIVSGRVVDITTGRDPQTHAIYTYVTLSVDQVMKGDIAEREITIKQLGGEIGDEGLGVAGQAAFGQGEDVLLFLETRPRDGTLYTSALWQGKWTLQRDATTGERIAVRNEPFRSDRGVFAGSERRPLQAFTSRVRALSQGAGARDFVVRPSEAEMKGAAHVPGVSSAPYVLPSPPYRWNEFDTGATIPVDVMGSGQPGLAAGGTSELLRAAGVWSGATGLKFASSGATTSRCFGAGTADGHISVVYGDPCGDIADTGNILAIGGATYFTTGGTTVNGTAFNRAAAGFVVNNNSAYAQTFLTVSKCFESVQQHELGHVLGLGHSADTAAIMYFEVALSACTAAVVPISADDFTGIKSIYPGATTTAAPAAPTGLTATATGSTVNLSWTASSSGGAATGFVIEGGSKSGGTDLANSSTGSTATTFSASNIGAGTYYVRVRATNAAGTSAASNEVTLVVGATTPTPTPTTTPGAPTGLTATKFVGTDGGPQVKFSWTAPSSGGAITVGYWIEYGLSPGAADGHLELALGSLNGATTYTLALGGVPSGTFYIRVRGVNGFGAGAASNEVTLVVGQ